MSMIDTGYFQGCHSYSEHVWELMRRGGHIKRRKEQTRQSPQEENNVFKTISLPMVNRIYPELIT